MNKIDKLDKELEKAREKAAEWQAKIRKEKTVPEEVPGADRGAPPFGPSWPEVLNGRPGADP